jgi:hypothetical protein
VPTIFSTTCDDCLVAPSEHANNYGQTLTSVRELEPWLRTQCVSPSWLRKMQFLWGRRLRKIVQISFNRSDANALFDRHRLRANPIIPEVHAQMMTRPIVPGPHLRLE